MKTQTKRMLAAVLALTLLVGPVPGAGAAVVGGDSQSDAGITPPRLGYTEGEVSFWRPGADDWAPAQVNTPLAPGDELYTGDRSNLELQVGSRAYVRAASDTQVGLVNQDPDFLQVKVTDGSIAVDLRSLDSGTTVEVDTPHAALSIDRPGYYRVDVSQDRTSFITRRGGRATVTPAGGQAVSLAASEEMVLDGLPNPTVQSYVAPEVDAWDRWNYARTDHLVDAVSARYVPPGVYGTETLDQYGNWREVPDYGPVWVPQSVPPDWVPYSTGQWIADPIYGWAWVDTAPWGWAPYHYGRWVFVDGFWAWAPGPMVRRAVYAPALVAFFGAPGVRVAIGAPFVSWVALCWGEPVVPWWGRSGFVGRPWWGGWGGPRVVNNVVINKTTVVNVNTINVYRNVNVRNAVVAVNQDQFGRRAVHEARLPQVDVQRLEPVRGALRVTPAASSYVAASGPARRPPQNTLSRPVVATRTQPARRSVPRGDSRASAPAAAPGTPGVAAPAPRIVPAPKRSEAAPMPPRPQFGTSSIERPRPPQPPSLESTQRSEPAASPVSREPARGAQPSASPAQPTTPPERKAERRPEATPPARQQGRAGQPPQPAPAQPAPAQPQRETRGAARPPAAAPAPPGQRVEPTQPGGHPLPGEPANRLYPGRAEKKQSRLDEQRAAPAPQPGAADGAARGRAQRQG